MNAGNGEVRVEREGLLRPLDRFQRRDIEWLWPGRIPRGMLSILEGDPGTGKSTLLLDLAARVSTGSPMPEQEAGADPATVVLLSAEDDASAVIRPRLEAAGADLHRVSLFAVLTDKGYEDPILSDKDVSLVEEQIQRHEAALLVVDPLVAYLPSGVDTSSDHSVRRALNRLKALAETTGAAVVVVRHFRKGGSENPLYRGGGSIGFIAAARAGLVVGSDPDDPSGRRRVLAPSKMNLAPMPPSLGFQLVVDSGQAFPRVDWLGISRHDASVLTSSPIEGRSEVEDAEAFLEDTLADGSKPAREVFKDSRAAGIADRTLNRAKARLGVRSSHVGAPGEKQRWEWALPKIANPRRGTGNLGGRGTEL